MRKLLIAVATALLALAFASCNDNGKENEDDNAALEINETTLAGTWEASVEHDFAQGYPQKWRIKFEGNSYTTWHTTQIIGPIGDDDKNLKTVGNKEQGSWEYADGMIVLIPAKQWASYVQTSMTPPKNTYYNYNQETMECDNWYETLEQFITDGVASDLEYNSEGYISKWRNASLTSKTLSVKINMDTFTFSKKN